MSAKRFLRATALLLALLMLSGCRKNNNNPPAESSASSGIEDTGYDLVIYHDRDSLRASLRTLASAYETATGKKIGFTYAENDLVGKIGSERPALYLISDYGKATDFKTNMKDYAAGGPSGSVYTAIPAGLGLDVSGEGSYGLPFEIEGRGYIVDPQTLADLFPGADNDDLIEDLQTCDYAEFKAFAKAVAAWIAKPSAAKALLNGHTYTLAKTKTGNAAALEAVFARTAEAGEMTSWLLDAAAASGYTAGDAFAGDLSGNTDAFRDYADAAAAAAELHFSNAVTKTYSDDDLVTGKALFIAGTTSFADNLKAGSEAADRLLILPIKVPHPANAGKTTASGAATSGNANASGTATTSGGAANSGKANTSGTATTSGTTTTSGGAANSGTATTSGGAANSGTTTTSGGAADVTPKTPDELDRCITVNVRSWFAVNPNADARQITEAEAFLKWLYSDTAGLGLLTGTFGTDWATLTGAGTPAASGNGAAGTSKTTAAGNASGGAANSAASGATGNASGGASTPAATGTTSGTSASGKTPAAGNASGGAANSAANGAASGATVSGNTSGATPGNGDSVGQFPDSLRLSLAAYLKAGDWVPSYYRYASEGWRANFESAAASYAQGNQFTEETRTGFVTGIFSDWGGKDTDSPLEQSLDQSAQGGG